MIYFKRNNKSPLNKQGIVDGINPDGTKIRIKSLNSNKSYIRSRVNVMNPKQKHFKADDKDNESNIYSDKSQI